MIFANILEMTDHPVLAPRSARSGSPIACSARTTHRGHPTWRLVQQLHRTTRLPALYMVSATSVVNLAITRESAPRTSTKSRMLHHVPEATAATTVEILPRR